MTTQRKAVSPRLHGPSRVQTLAVLLVACGLADLLMTYLLLQASPRYYEVNPVANWFFTQWNMFGMTIYKFALVGFVIALCEIIERARHGWGQWVLAAGCLATVAVFARGLHVYLGLDS
jgi:hypothetical protein